MVMANTNGGGDNNAVSVNMTPPLAIPIPYDNNSQRAMAVPNVPHIMIMGAPSHNLATVIPVSNGDQPGAQGGVASGTVSSTSRNINGANTVLLEGLPTTRMSDPTLQNSTNTLGAGTSPSQTKVLVMAG